MFFGILAGLAIIYMAYLSKKEDMNNEDLNSKKKQLDEAVKKENYEKAAELRDEILRIETINHQKKSHDTIKK